jgi:hypothetical protein
LNAFDVDIAALAVIRTDSCHGISSLIEDRTIKIMAILASSKSASARARMMVWMIRP